MLHGEPSSYEGRQSFGTGEGSLIDHIKRLNTLCNENPQWENYLVETGGSDALLQDRHEKRIHLKRVHSLLKPACYAFRNRTERFGKAR